MYPYELRMSEDAAARRSSAARLVKRFPLLLHAIAGGELHLTGLLMLGPHLTPENHVEVLARAKFRTKKELAKLVRELSPLPLVPDLMVPLGPEPPRPLRVPTWEEWVTSLAPPVRELRPGEAPRDWANDTVECADASEPVTAPARFDLPPVTAPQQYQMQFSTTEEHVRLVERAKALLARSSPGASLGELHLQAMQLLVAALEKKKFAVTERPRKTKASMLGEQTPNEAPRQRGGDLPRASKAVPRQRGGDRTDPAGAPRQRGDETRAPTTTPATPRRGRSIPAAIRRAVFARDGGSCSYVDERGTRCGEGRDLELHHLKPFAQGGEHLASNLALRCAAHNALAAEQDFGRSIIEARRDAARHGSFGRSAEAASWLGRPRCSPTAVGDASSVGKQGSPGRPRQV